MKKELSTAQELRKLNRRFDRLFNTTYIFTLTENIIGINYPAGGLTKIKKSVLLSAKKEIVDELSQRKSLQHNRKIKK